METTDFSIMIPTSTQNDTTFEKIKEPDELLSSTSISKTTPEIPIEIFAGGITLYNVSVENSDIFLDEFLSASKTEQYSTETSSKVEEISNGNVLSSSSSHSVI